SRELRKGRSGKDVRHAPARMDGALASSFRLSTVQSTGTRKGIHREDLNSLSFAGAYPSVIIELAEVVGKMRGEMKEKFVYAPEPPAGRQGVLATEQVGRNGREGAVHRASRDGQLLQELIWRMAAIAERRLTISNVVGASL